MFFVNNLAQSYSNKSIIARKKVYTIKDEELGNQFVEHIENFNAGNRRMSLKLIDNILLN